MFARPSRYLSLSGGARLDLAHPSFDVSLDLACPERIAVECHVQRDRTHLVGNLAEAAGLQHQDVVGHGGFIKRDRVDAIAFQAARDYATPFGTLRIESVARL